MNHTFKLTLAAVCMLGGLSQAVAADKVIAVLNGKKLTESQLIAFAKGQTEQADALLNDPQNRSKVIDALVDREMLYQEAINKKLDQDPEIKAQLDEVRRRLLSQALVQRMVAENPVSEKDIKNYYNNQLEKLRGNEYLVHHILLKSEADANAAIQRLNKGEDFSALAKALSTDVSAKEGGKIGWLPPQALPPGMASAVQNTTVKSYHNSPVKTDHGWHVVKVADSRPMQPPPLERVRPQIENALRTEFMRDYIDQVRNKAKIDLK